MKYQEAVNKIQDQIVEIKTNCVKLNEEGKTAIDELIESNQTNVDFTTHQKALIAELWGAFRNITGKTINEKNFYKKTKSFNYKNQNFEIYLTLDKGQLIYGIEPTEVEEETNYII